MWDIGYKIRLHLLILHAGIYSHLNTVTDRINGFGKCYVVGTKILHINLGTDIPVFDILNYMDDLISVKILSVYEYSDHYIHDHRNNDAGNTNKHKKNIDHNKDRIRDPCAHNYAGVICCIYNNILRTEDKLLDKAVFP